MNLLFVMLIVFLFQLLHMGTARSFSYETYLCLRPLSQEFEATALVSPLLASRRYTYSL